MYLTNYSYFSAFHIDVVNIYFVFFDKQVNKIQCTTLY